MLIPSLHMAGILGSGLVPTCYIFSVNLKSSCGLFVELCVLEKYCCCLIQSTVTANLG